MDAPKNWGHFLTYSSLDTDLMMLTLSRRIFSVYEIARLQFFIALELEEHCLKEVEELNLRNALAEEYWNDINNLIKNY